MAKIKDVLGKAMDAVTKQELARKNAQRTEEFIMMPKIINKK